MARGVAARDPRVAGVLARQGGSDRMGGWGVFGSSWVDPR